jgi:hypothetical protein
MGVAVGPDSIRFGEDVVSPGVDCPPSFTKQPAIPAVREVARSRLRFIFIIFSHMNIKLEALLTFGFGT